MMSPEEVDQAEEAYRDAVEMSFTALFGSEDARREAARLTAVAMDKLRPLIDTVRELRTPLYRTLTGNVSVEMRGGQPVYLAPDHVERAKR